jgi:hypothetical protein
VFQIAAYIPLFFFSTIIFILRRFQVLTVASTKMAVFWVTAPCRLVEINRCFKHLLPPNKDTKTTSYKEL